MLRVVFLLLSSISFIASAVPDRRIIINENYGTVMSYEQFEKYEKDGQIKTIDTSSDTVKVTLNGPKIAVHDISEYNRCYSASLYVNGKKHGFQRIEIPSFSPKSTQYNLTDSCFYLTFMLSAQNQTKGEKMDVSVFVFCDSIPSQGQRFKIVTPDFNYDNPIMEWRKDMGYFAVMQVGKFPKAAKIISDQNSINNNQVVFSTLDFTGEIEVLSIKQGSYQDQLEIELGIAAKTILESEHYNAPGAPFDINGKISLYQVERADIVPCYFEIDYTWPECFISLDAFD